MRVAVFTWEEVEARAKGRAAGYIDELKAIALESNDRSVKVDADSDEWKAFVARHAKCDNCDGAHRTRECPIPRAFDPAHYARDSRGTDPCSC